MYPDQTVSNTPNYGPPLVGGTYVYSEEAQPPMITPYGYQATIDQGFYPGPNQYYGSQRSPTTGQYSTQPYPQSDTTPFDPNNQGPPSGYYLGPDGFYHWR